MQHVEFWKMFERTGAERFADYGEWVRLAEGLTDGQRRVADHYAQGWAVDSFRTFKAFRARGLTTYVDRPLALPDAATVADLFEAARFIETPGGARTHQDSLSVLEARAGGPGFLFASGASRGKNAAPCGHMGGVRSWSPKFLASGENIRQHTGGAFFASYVKPNDAVRADWEKHVGDPDGKGQGQGAGDFSLGGFEFVERADGVLIIARAGGSGIFQRWIALLPPGSSLVEIMPQADRDFLAAEMAAEVAAWEINKDIAERVTGAYGDESKPGEFLTMGDGSKWFHPYGGGAPQMIDPPRSIAPLPAGGKAIAADVLSVLAAAETDGLNLRLTGKLDRRLYMATDKVLEALGGKWNSRAGVHTFPHDAGELLGEVLATRHYVDAKKAFQAFYTPAALAARVVEAADIKEGEKVLEPGAGGGALLRPAIAAGAKVWAYEIDPKAHAALVTEFFSQFGAGGLGDDFMAAAVPDHPPFDKVIMNPPFSGGQDVRHVMHAAKFVKPGGRLVAIMSPGVVFRQTEPYKGFRAWCEEHGATVEHIAAGTFKESGTDVSTVIVTVDL